MKGNKKQPQIKSDPYPYHLEIDGKTSIPQLQTNTEYAEYREYRKKWETNPKLGIVSDFPLSLNIEVTGRCNLMCEPCFRYSRRNGIGDMDIGLFEKIIDEGREHNLYSINPSWMGEPFLHPELIEMIKYAKSKKILDIRINTNGTLIDKEMSEKILDSGLDSIIFSVDAITEKTYNKIKCGSDFNLINKNINYLISRKEEKRLEEPKIIVQMIDQKQSHSELMSFIYYWKNKADGIRIATYQSPDGRPNDRRRVQNTPETIFPCSQLWQRLVIAWDGTVYPCTGDNAGREPLGNVKEQKLYDIWNGETLNYLRDKHSKFEADDIEACLHCDLNKIPSIINNYGKEQNERR